MFSEQQGLDLKGLSDGRYNHKSFTSVSKPLACRCSPQPWPWEQVDKMKGRNYQRKCLLPFNLFATDD